MEEIQQQPEEILDMAAKPKFRISWQVVFVCLMFLYVPADFCINIF